jgi:serine O-acetyltransferase
MARAHACWSRHGNFAPVANSRPDQDHDADLPEFVSALLESYRSDGRAHHINRRFLPSRTEIIESVQLLLQLLYPGYHGRQDLTDQNLPYHVGVLLSNLREKLQRQIGLCLCYQRELTDCKCELATFRCEAGDLTSMFLRRLPAIRAMLIEDIQAAFDGDPAALNLDEIILAYPGLLATTVYRLAHELHKMSVPLMPRIMTEWAHSQTGADIHPGAEIGESFFLDHATGAVIGETSQIGAHVKLYQGVTLGALSHPRDEQGRVIRGAKRHPTVEDNVTIYANATVLGGDTVLGNNSLIGGSVFLTYSVPPASRVALKPPELRVRLARAAELASPTDPTPQVAINPDSLPTPPVPGAEIPKGNGHIEHGPDSQAEGNGARGQPGAHLGCSDEPVGRGVGSGW